MNCIKSIFSCIFIAITLPACVIKVVGREGHYLDESILTYHRDPDYHNCVLHVFSKDSQIDFEIYPDIATARTYAFVNDRGKIDFECVEMASVSDATEIDFGTTSALAIHYVMEDLIKWYTPERYDEIISKIHYKEAPCTKVKLQSPDLRRIEFLWSVDEYNMAIALDHPCSNRPQLERMTIYFDYDFRNRTIGKYKIIDTIS